MGGVKNIFKVIRCKQIKFLFKNSIRKIVLNIKFISERKTKIIARNIQNKITV